MSTSSEHSTNPSSSQEIEPFGLEDSTYGSSNNTKLVKCLANLASPLPSASSDAIGIGSTIKMNTSSATDSPLSMPSPTQDSLDFSNGNGNKQQDVTSKDGAENQHINIGTDIRFSIKAEAVPQDNEVQLFATSATRPTSREESKESGGPAPWERRKRLALTSHEESENGRPWDLNDLPMSTDSSSGTEISSSSSSRDPLDISVGEGNGSGSKPKNATSKDGSSDDEAADDAVPLVGNSASPAAESAGIDAQSSRKKNDIASPPNKNTENHISDLSNQFAIPCDRDDEVSFVSASLGSNQVSKEDDKRKTESLQLLSTPAAESKSNRKKDDASASADRRRDSGDSGLGLNSTSQLGSTFRGGNGGVGLASSASSSLSAATAPSNTDKLPSNQENQLVPNGSSSPQHRDDEEDDGRGENGQKIAQEDAADDETNRVAEPNGSTYSTQDVTSCILNLAVIVVMSGLGFVVMSGLGLGIVVMALITSMIVSMIPYGVTSLICHVVASLDLGVPSFKLWFSVTFMVILTIAFVRGKTGGKIRIGLYHPCDGSSVDKAAGGTVPLVGNLAKRAAESKSNRKKDDASASSSTKNDQRSGDSGVGLNPGRSNQLGSTFRGGNGGVGLASLPPHLSRLLLLRPTLTKYPQIKRIS